MNTSPGCGSSGSGPNPQPRTYYELYLTAAQVAILRRDSAPASGESALQDFEHDSIFAMPEALKMSPELELGRDHGVEVKDLR